MSGLLPNGCLPGQITTALAGAINQIEHGTFVSFLFGLPRVCARLHERWDGLGIWGSSGAG